MSMKPKKQTALWTWQLRCKNGEEHCRICGEKRDLTVEHIAPVNILEQFGLDKIDILYNMEENFEILCRYCNRMKGGRMDMRHPQTFVVLEKVIGDAKQYFSKIIK